MAGEAVLTRSLPTFRSFSVPLLPLVVVVVVLSFAGESLQTNQPTPLHSPPSSPDSPLPPYAHSYPIRTAPTTAVPPLTPDSSPTNHPSYIQHARLSSTTAAAAPSFLQALFPSNALEATAVSKEVLITSNGTSKASWHGALLDASQVPGSPVLLVGVPVAEGVEIRHNVEILVRPFPPFPVRLPFVPHTPLNLSSWSGVPQLDLASDHLDCSTLIFVLDKSSPDLRELVHGLLFIGGTIVQPHARNGWEWKVDGGKVLIGMEL